MEVTKEQIQEAVEYLDSIEGIQKAQDGMDLSSTVNGGGSENITELKSEMLGLIKKAKEIQDKIEKIEGKKEEKETIEKAVEKEKVDPEEEKPVEKEKEKEDPMDKEDIIKSVKAEVIESFTGLLSSKDEEITLLKSQIDTLSEKVEEIESTPLRKSFTNGAPLSFKDRFEKAQGEGKTVLSKTLQKGQISKHIYNLFVESTDEIEKGELSHAITQFESAGYLDPKIESKLSQKYNLEIL